jgi:oxaloacetate decarboxylase alpha subunit
MTGTLRNQLEQHGMGDRMAEVIEEIAIVRSDLGEPVMATPFSQFVGIQAVLNIVAGERYKLVPDEVIQYTLGHMGPLMRPVEPEVADRILSQPRAAELRNWERPQPTLREIREQLGRNLSDEELILRYLIPAEHVDAMLEGPPAPTSASEIVANVRELVAEAPGLSRISLSRPGLKLDLRRRAS